MRFDRQSLEAVVIGKPTEFIFEKFGYFAARLDNGKIRIGIRGDDGRLLTATDCPASHRKYGIVLDNASRLNAIEDEERFVDVLMEIGL